MTTQQIAVFIVWAVLLLGVAYLIRDAYRQGSEKVAIRMVSVFSVLTAPFVVYAAGAFGVDVEQVKDFYESLGGKGG